jgi:hypothetical protein
VVRDLTTEVLLHQLVKVGGRRRQSTDHLVLLGRDRAAEEVVDK